MKPLELLTVKAFLFARCQYKDALPDDIQNRVRALASSGKYAQLDNIAYGYPPLAENYKLARRWMGSQAKERKQGWADIPDEGGEQFSTETENLSRQMELHNRKEILDAIEKKLDSDDPKPIVLQILNYNDCKQISQQLGLPPTLC